MANAHLDMKNMHGYLHAIRRLHNLTPNRAEVKLGLAGAYLSNGRLALALQTFRQYLKKWSKLEQAAEVQETVAKLETGLADSIPERFPDYFFGWVISARRAMEKDDLDTAKEFIEKMMVT